MLQFAKAEVFSRETHVAWQKKLISAVEKIEAAQKRAAKKAAESQVAADKAMERAKKHTKAHIAAQAEEARLAEEGGALREELAKLFPETALCPTLWVEEWETEPTEDELYEIHMNYTGDM